MYKRQHLEDTPHLGGDEYPHLCDTPGKPPLHKGAGPVSGLSLIHIYFESYDLYKENGFKKKEKAQELIDFLTAEEPVTCQVVSIEKKKEKKNPPLLYNLAELQNDCSRRFKLSPDETLRIVQEPVSYTHLEEGERI